MKHWMLGALVVALTATAPSWTEAKRMGGGGSFGMQRSAPAKAPAQSPPAQQAAQPAASPQRAAPAAPAAGAAAAAAPAKRSWMGPIAGLAAGLGLAALMSHLGLGEAFANFLMMALLGVAAVFLVVFLMRRFGKPAHPQAMASAGAGATGAPAWGAAAQPRATEVTPAPAGASRSAFTLAASDVSVTGQPLRPMGGLGTGEPAAEDAAVQARVGRWTDPLEAPSLPEGFDMPAFERVAKMIFIRMQAANDAGDLDDLRQFTTPEMFAAVRLDLQERAGTQQHTDVERVDASVVDFATESGRQIVSVRFHGLIREELGAPSQAFDEIWHLVKPEGEGGTWAIAGIQQAQ